MKWKDEVMIEGCVCRRFKFSSLTQVLYASPLKLFDDRLRQFGLIIYNKQPRLIHYLIHMEFELNARSS